MLNMICRDHAAAELARSGFGEGHHSLRAYRVVDDFFTVGSFAKHPAYLWRDLQDFGDARSTFYAKVMAGRTAFSMKEGGGALSSCDRFFKIWSIWKNNLDEPFGNFTTARIRLTTSATQQWHEFL